MNYDKKKRRDFLILAAYVALIYSTLYVAPAIFEKLNEILGAAFRSTVNTFIVLIALTIFSLSYRKLLHRRPSVYIGIAAVIIIYAILITYLTPMVIEKVHLIEYGFMGYLALRAFQGVRSRDTRYMCVIAIITIVGYCDELIQFFLPNRFYDLMDVYLNVLSGLLGLALVRLVTFPGNKI